MSQRKLKRPKINGKQSKTWYVVWSEDGRSHRYSTGKTDRIAAERVLARFEAVTPPETFDITELSEAYVRANIKAGKSEANMRTSLKPVLKEFGRDTPATISQSKVRDYIEMRRKSVKDGTIARELNTLRAALNWGEMEKWMERAPRIKVPQAGPPRQRFLTKEEFSLLENAVDTLHLKTFLALAINTGSRAAKILALEWSQVDFERKIIWYERGTHSNKRTSPIPINKALAEALEFALPFAVGESVVEFNGKPIKSIKKTFERAVKRAGLEDVHIHDLRRTAASWALMGGASLDDIAAFLGDDIKVVQKHYAQFSPNHIRSVVDILG